MPSAPPKHSVSVAAAIVNDEGQVLAIQRRDNGAWEPPGGVLELSESITDGLRREVYEETSLTVEALSLTGVYKNMRRHIVALVFRCRVLDGTPHSSEESQAFRWLDRQAVQGLVSNGHMADAFAARLLDAMDETEPVHIRSHDGTHLIEAHETR